MAQFVANYLIEMGEAAQDTKARIHMVILMEQVARGEPSPMANQKQIKITRSFNVVNVDR